MVERWILAALVLPASACSDGGYKRGDCAPGELEVDGTCELAVGQPCTRNGDCLANICVVSEDRDPFCSIRCKLHDDCPTGFYCRPGSPAVCYPGKRPPRCRDDADCDPCTRCIDESCLPVPGCVACTTDEECGTCERCGDEGECIQVAGCVPCQSDLDCPPCETCGPDGACTPRVGCILCGSDEDCPGCSRCSRGACEPIEGCGTDPCFNQNDCPLHTLCLYDPQLGHNTCMPADLPFGADCARGGDVTCAEGICVTEPDGQQTCSRPCTRDSDCPAPTTCSPDDDCRYACRFESSRPGPGCAHDADCPAGMVCGLLVDGDAWEPRCRDPLPCAAGPGEACNRSQDDRCTTGICTTVGFCSPVCAADFDCPVGFLCDLLELPLPEGGQAPFMGCAPEDQVLGAVGETCPHGGDDCKSGLCLESAPGGPHPFCTRDCTPGGADCPDGFSCRPGPPPDTLDLCQPAVLGGTCSADEDCPGDQVCTLDADAGTFCVDPLPGGSAPGGTCGEEMACANGLCLRQGRCAAVCRQPDDCPADFICDYLPVYPSSGEPAHARLCVPDPGSMLPCQRDQDCPGGERCGVVLNPWGTGLRGRCAPSGSGGDTGAACTAPQDCQSGFCPAGGRCTQLCTGDADCPAEHFCGAVWVSLWPGASFAVDACVRQATGELGDPCPGGAGDCVSGICLHPGEEEPYCSLECTVDEDCAAAEGMVCLDDGSAVLYCMIPP